MRGRQLDTAIARLQLYMPLRIEIYGFFRIHGNVDTLPIFQFRRATGNIFELYSSSSRYS